MRVPVGPDTYPSLSGQVWGRSKLPASQPSIPVEFLFYSWVCLAPTPGGPLSIARHVRSWLALVCCQVREMHGHTSSTALLCSTPARPYSFRRRSPAAVAQRLSAQLPVRLLLLLLLQFQLQYLAEQTCTVTATVTVLGSSSNRATHKGAIATPTPAVGMFMQAVTELPTWTTSPPTSCTPSVTSFWVRRRWACCCDLMTPVVPASELVRSEEGVPRRRVLQAVCKQSRCNWLQL